MAPESIFQVANLVALAGWATLGLGVLTQRRLLIVEVAGRAVPLALSALYALLIASFWIGADGGFGSLAEIAELFRQPWLLLAGWIHYLAFDLMIGSFIAVRAGALGMPRLLIVALLPVVFLFGPLGYLAFSLLTPAFRAAPAT